MVASAFGIETIRRVPRRLCLSVWERLPEDLLRTTFMRRTGKYIYRNYSRDTVRVQTHYTQFMRNRPLLKTLAELAAEFKPGQHVSIISMGCSTGAELYSALHVLSEARPDLHWEGLGSDLSSAVVQVAERGVYFPDVPAGEGGLFDPGRPEVTRSEVSAFRDLFDELPDGSLSICARLRSLTRWQAIDAMAPDLLERVGPQDFVLANNFIGPMEDRMAEKCLRNIMTLVKAGGYLIVDGIDLDLKIRVLRASGFKPVLARQEEIWSSDNSKKGWPFLRWAAEPLDRTEPDWAYRYSMIFRANGE